MRNRTRTLLAAAILAAASIWPAASADRGAPAPVQMTAQEDHQRTMSLLHIDKLRQGANGSNPQAPNYANYDESKANPYPNLPDPLILKSGKKVKSAKEWWTRRDRRSWRISTARSTAACRKRRPR